ncbi:hypothetical protein, partial [Yoonia sp. R2-816]|uniref:hypothetical protein n=1 Tax=Yoonia sp. R2-816 TaxID=3342638 RepID=UPI0037277B72
MRRSDEEQRGQKGSLSPDIEALIDVIHDCRSEAVIYRSAIGSRMARLKKTKTGYFDKISRRDIENVLGTLPSIFPEWLGSQSFLKRC